MSNIKRQSERVKIQVPENRTENVQITLDTNYERCIGIITKIVEAGNDPACRMGLNINGDVIEDPNHIENWVASTGVPMDGRVKPYDFQLDAGRITLVFETSESVPTTNQQDAVYDLTFILAR